MVGCSEAIEIRLCLSVRSLVILEQLAEKTALIWMQDGVATIAFGRQGQDYDDRAAPRGHERESLRSFVRGEARPDSDLDLLIEAGANTTPFFPGGLIADLEDALGRRVDVVEEQGLHRLLRDRIRQRQFLFE